MFNRFIVSKKNLINNIRQVKKQNPKSKICAMVKANAYGVGMDFVVKTIDNFIDYYGVACFFEAKMLSRLTKKKILIVGPLGEEINNKFSYSCSSIEDVQKLQKLNKRCNIHLKINSGMNRYGFKDLKEFENALKLLKESKLVFEGIFTHFATNDEYTSKQMEVFSRFIALARMYNYNPLVHADNSEVNIKQNHHLDMVRVGFSLYNLNADNFKPVVEIRSKVAQINIVHKGEIVGYDYRFVADKDMKVAVIPVGYADGFLIGYKDLPLTLHNQKCKVLNVCMDCFMLDVSNTQLKKGDEVEILGPSNPLKLYAEHINAIEYEVMCNFSKIRADKILSSVSTDCKDKQ